MTIIEGVGDEVTNFFIVLLTIIIAIIAWWTTNTSDQGHFRTVVVLNGSRRVSRMLTNHTETVTVSESSPITTLVQQELAMAENSGLDEELSVPELTDYPVQSEETQLPGNSTTTPSGASEETNIIKTMDQDNCVLRKRNAAPTENAAGSSGHSDPDNEESKIEATDKATSIKETERCDVDKDQQDKTKITIKLKYINDDLKMVDGNVDELLGDFKKRHFQTEMDSGKTVKLIFNGHVLQQDQDTLKNCGLFDHCVVHCLVHQKRPNTNQSEQENVRNPNTNYFRSTTFVGNNNNNQNRDWDLGNVLFAVISFLLLAAWYFRYVYAHLYTVTATIGLTLITGIFTMVSVGMYLTENEPPAANPAPTIRITRTERLEIRHQ